jgi:hypothetical protein
MKKNDRGGYRMVSALNFEEENAECRKISKD